MMAKSLSALKPSHYKRFKTTGTIQETDPFSELPDEMMLSIIVSFTMKEAARLSFVSRRWKFICRCVPVLIFEDTQAMERYYENWDTIPEERHRFVRWVDRVIEEHLGTNIDELRIIFGLDQDWQSHVDKWASFAVDKQVKRLELNFLSPWRAAIRKGRRVCGDPLDLPPKLFKIKSSITSLYLKDVNVTDEFIDYLSHSCPLLENLCIVGSNCLTRLRLSDSLEHVKHLEVSDCNNLKMIDISASKLCSFIHYSHPIELHIAHAPSLIEASIGNKESLYCITYLFDSLSEYLSQLVYLSLRITLFGKMNLGINSTSAMPNLQHLELQVLANFDQSLRGWTSLIAASPRLQRLTLKLSGHPTIRDWRVCKWVGLPLKCLKTLELFGYVGRTIDHELAFFVFENASMLEEVIIDFVPIYFAKRDNKAQERLVNLRMKLPEGVKLTLK